jgi:hypothetical protein
MRSRAQSVGRMIISTTGAAIVALATGAALAQAPAADPAAPAVEEKKEEAKPLVGYDKGFFLTDPKGLFKLVIGARMQGRFTFEKIESHKTNDAGEDIAATTKDPEYDFRIARARLKLSGHVFSERVAYLFQVDFGKGNPMLKDYYADLGLVPDVLYLRVGQFKRPFSRQQITSSGNQELVDRAITDKSFGAGRDIGVMLHNNYEKSPKLEWALGMFNGTGETPWLDGDVTSTVNDDGSVSSEISPKSAYTNVPTRFKPALVGRIGFNTGKIKGYSEADLEGGPFRLGMGTSVQANFDSDETGGAGTKGEVDFIMKAAGFSLNGAAYLASVQDGAGFKDQKYGAWGLHAQAGYVIKEHVQPVVRYALVDPDGDDNNTQEIMGGLSIYIFQHNLKWQTEAGALLRQDPAGGLTDFVLRSQLQLGF